MANEPTIILADKTSVDTATFRERIEVAAAAGFDALGISLATIRAVTEHEMSAAEIMRVLDANGTSILELDFVIGFALDPDRTGALGEDPPQTSYEEVEELLEMAALFGARHLQAVGTLGSDRPEPDAAERFAQLCDRAAPYDLKIGLEFIPHTSVPDARTARRIVAEAGRPNGGVCADSWHQTRGSNDPEQLREILPGQLTVIQLSDGPVEPGSADYFVDTMRSRRIPGEGEFDLSGFVSAVWHSGARAPISVEVISDALREMNAGEVAHRLVEATRQLLARAAVAW